MLGLVLENVNCKARKDKLTFIAEGFAGSLVPWLEQLIAESSGKEGKGILPIENEPVLVSQNYLKIEFLSISKLMEAKLDWWMN